MRRTMLAAFAASVGLWAAPVIAAELKPKTVEAFDHYVRLTEQRTDKELKLGNPFLWVDGLAEPERGKAYSKLRQGQLIIEHLETQDGGKRIKIPDGLVHHWVALCFIPKVTLQQTLSLVQDYNHHQDIYKPDVVRSKLLRVDGDDYKVYMRLYRKAVVTAVFNVEFDVRYYTMNATRAYSRAYSTRLAEVENAGEPDEKEKPVGRDRGFLWRLYSYWRFEERDGGVYVQLESIALSRSVPAIIAWLVNPYLKKIPREYLTHILDQTREALTSKLPTYTRAERTQ